VELRPFYCFQSAKRFKFTRFFRWRMDRSEASFLTLRIPILPRHILRALHYVRSMERYAADDEQAKVKRLLLGFLSAGRHGRGQARAWRPSEEGYSTRSSRRRSIDSRRRPAVSLAASRQEGNLCPYPCCITLLLLFAASRHPTTVNHWPTATRQFIYK
jgi:hypothetical protein